MDNTYVANTFGISDSIAKSEFKKIVVFFWLEKKVLIFFFLIFFIQVYLVKVVSYEQLCFRAPF